MTREEKAKAYDEAIERAKDFMNGEVHYELKMGENIMCWIFPELRESEDERIRKALIEMVHDTTADELLFDYCIHKEDALAWLEKQESIGEIVERCKTSWYNEGKIAGMAEGLTDDEKYQQGWHDALEKQGERKPFDYENATIVQKDFSPKVTSKIEPKFKVGDWVLHNTAGFVYMIQTIGRDGYGVISRDGKTSVVNYSAEIYYRLWSIKDAKDGDVLANDYYIFILKKSADYWSSDRTPNSVKAYCGIKPNGNFEIGKDNWCFCGTLNIHPATKEQRELLFQKMRETGYYWNFNTKTISKY